jgi:hypothetical protein
MYGKYLSVAERAKVAAAVVVVDHWTRIVPMIFDLTVQFKPSSIDTRVPWYIL